MSSPKASDRKSLTKQFTSFFGRGKSKSTSETQPSTPRSTKNQQSSPTKPSKAAAVAPAQPQPPPNSPPVPAPSDSNKTPLRVLLVIIVITFSFASFFVLRGSDSEVSKANCSNGDGLVCYDVGVAAGRAKANASIPQNLPSQGQDSCKAQYNDGYQIGYHDCVKSVGETTKQTYETGYQDGVKSSKETTKQSFDNGYQAGYRDAQGMTAQTHQKPRDETHAAAPVHLMFGLVMVAAAIACVGCLNTWDATTNTYRPLTLATFFGVIIVLLAIALLSYCEGNPDAMDYCQPVQEISPNELTSAVVSAAILMILTLAFVYYRRSKPGQEDPLRVPLRSSPSFLAGCETVPDDAQLDKLRDSLFQQEKEADKLRFQLFETTQEVEQLRQQLEQYHNEKNAKASISGNPFEFYDIAVHMKNVQDASTSGWPVLFSDVDNFTQFKSEVASFVVSITGDLNVGKAWILSQIAGGKLQSGNLDCVQPLGISIKVLDLAEQVELTAVPSKDGALLKQRQGKKAYFIDTKALSSQVPPSKRKSGQRERGSSNLDQDGQGIMDMQEFERQVVLSVSDIFLFVVGQLSGRHQLDLHLLLKEIKVLRRRFHGVEQRVLIIHNLKDWSQEQFESEKYLERIQTMYGEKGEGFWAKGTLNCVTREGFKYLWGQSIDESDSSKKSDLSQDQTGVRFEHLFLTRTGSRGCWNDQVFSYIRNLLKSTQAGRSCLAERLGDVMRSHLRKVPLTDRQDPLSPEKSSPSRRCEPVSHLNFQTGFVDEEMAKWDTTYGPYYCFFNGILSEGFVAKSKLKPVVASEMDKSPRS